MYKDFNIKRQEAKTYDKLTENERTEKVKQIQAALALQQQFFTQASESNENITYHLSPHLLLKVRSSKTVMKMVENICPEKKKKKK